MWKRCDIECVKDRYQCCVIFACFLSCVLDVFNSPVVTPAHGLLGLSPSFRLQFISEDASSVCISTVLLH